MAITTRSTRRIAVARRKQQNVETNMAHQVQTDKSKQQSKVCKKQAKDKSRKSQEVAISKTELKKKGEISGKKTNGKQDKICEANKKKVYCYATCKLGRKYDQQMIQCCSCMMWIHHACAELEDSHSSVIWNCHFCRQSVTTLNSLTNHVEDIRIQLTRLCDLNENLLQQLSQKTTDYERVLEENYQLKQRLLNYGEDCNFEEQFSKDFQTQVKTKNQRNYVVRGGQTRGKTWSQMNRQVKQTKPMVQEQTVLNYNHSNHSTRQGNPVQQIAQTPQLQPEQVHHKTMVSHHAAPLGSMLQQHVYQPEQQNNLPSQTVYHMLPQPVYQPIHMEPGHYLSCASSGQQMILTQPRQQQAVQFSSQSNVKYNNNNMHLSRTPRAPMRHNHHQSTNYSTIVRCFRCQGFGHKSYQCIV